MEIRFFRERTVLVEQVVEQWFFAPDEDAPPAPEPVPYNDVEDVLMDDAHQLDEYGRPDDPMDVDQAEADPQDHRRHSF